MNREIRSVRGTRICGDPITERGLLDAPEAQRGGEVLEAEEEPWDCGEVHGEPLRPLLLPFGPFGEAHGEGWWEPFGEPAEGVALTDGEGSRGNRS